MDSSNNSELPVVAGPEHAAQQVCSSGACCTGMRGFFQVPLLIAACAGLGFAGASYVQDAKSWQAGLHAVTGIGADPSMSGCPLGMSGGCCHRDTEGTSASTESEGMMASMSGSTGSCCSSKASAMAGKMASGAAFEGTCCSASKVEVAEACCTAGDSCCAEGKSCCEAAAEAAVAEAPVDALSPVNFADSEASL